MRQGNPQKKKVRISRLVRVFTSAHGFTIAEILVMLAIITAVSAVVLANFTSIGEQTLLNRTMRDLLLGIRKTQNIALAITQLPSGVVPSRAGIQLSTLAGQSAQYIIFADSNDNFKYDPPPVDTLIAQVPLERGLYISTIKDQAGATKTTVHIFYTPPEAIVSFADGNGNLIPGSLLEIELKTPTGLSKKIVVRISGQVTVK